MARSLVGGTWRSVGAWRFLVGLAAWVVAAGCGSSDSASMFDSNADEGGVPTANASSGGARQSNGTGASINNGASGSNAVITTPEQKVNVDFDAPQSSKNYVYATNTERDSVAVIDAMTLAIHVVNTGDQPRFLRTLPGRDAALLVDVGANDLAYIETTGGNSKVSYYRDLPSANVVAVAPDGNHAVAYFDVTRMQQGKFETLQDVSIMSFGATGPVATRMTVGFKPRQVTFAGGPTGSAAAYIVTDDGISVLDFAQIDAAQKSAIAPTIPMFSATEPKGESISVTPNGAYAVGRVAGTTRLRLVELASGKARDLDLATALSTAATPDLSTGGAAGAGTTASNNGVAGTSNAGSSSAATGGIADQASGGSSSTNSSDANGGAAGETSGATAGAAGAGMSVGGRSFGGTTSRTTAAGGVTASNNSSSGTAVGGTATSSSSTTAAPPAADITDLVGSPDGTFALAVSRNRGVLLRIAIPNGFVDPSQVSAIKIDDVTVGSVAISPNGRWAVLFTTVVVTERRIVIVDLTGVVEQRALDLKKTIKGVAFSSSGDQAYVLHSKEPGDPTATGIDTQTVLDRSYGYSLVDLSKAFRKLVVTDSDPNLSVTTPGAPYVFLSFAGQSTLVQRLDMESLQVDEIVLGSIPISLGVVPAAKRVFVNQAYTEGRLTFVDWASLNVQTVTGYELNSKIRE